MKFLDQAKIFIKSGDGGDGCVSFRREKFVEFGGPDGGDGGRGGSVIFKAVPALNTLIDFRYKQHFKAEKGHHGRGANQTGGAGKDLIISVPVGTQILSDNKEHTLADFTAEGQTLTLLRGGDGGFGNTHFKSSRNQAPRQSIKGYPGEELWVWLRLKLIADVGLVGLPNAGKSTLLSVVSRAKPKIADYPFTTLVPQLGVVYVHEKEFVLADIPGLIEGAHEGTGLGDRFLGHVERCALLLHLIDGTQEDVVEAYSTIQNELKMYDQNLYEKEQLLVLNKCDALSESDLKEKVRCLEAASQQKVYPMSGATRQNVDAIMERLVTRVKKEDSPSDKPFGIDLSPLPESS